MIICTLIAKYNSLFLQREKCVKLFNRRKIIHYNILNFNGVERSSVLWESRKMKNSYTLSTIGKSKGETILKHRNSLVQ